MAKLLFTRRRLLAGAAAPLAAAPFASRLLLDGSANAATHDHGAMVEAAARDGHAAMVGAGVPAVGGPHDLDDLLHPPAALPYSPGRVREYHVVATDNQIEVAPGVF